MPRDGARRRLFDAVDAALTDLAARAPLLLVIDDFHWADRGSLLLTSFLLRSSRPGPVLVLGTYRDTELGRHCPLTAAVGELKHGGTLDRIDLRGLPLDDVATLARSILGTDELAARVHSRTNGNAFFVEEVLRNSPGPGRTRCQRASGTRSASGCHGWAMLVRAGNRALGRLAYEDAAERFDWALQALELADAEDDAGPLLLARGNALARAGEPEAARAAFTAARELLGD